MRIARRLTHWRVAAIALTSGSHTAVRAMTAGAWASVLALTVGAFAASASFAAAPAPASGPRVAVFDQPGFPAYNVPASIAPRQIEADLDAAGVPADLLDSAALADPARLNAGAYAAVVLPYGNVYPREAFRNLQAFHRAGGCLILSGVPFTHPVERDPLTGWKDLGHRSEPAGFGPDGIGVGGFRGGAPGRVAIATGDPLGLKALRLDWGEGDHIQTLDPSSLPAGVGVVPALTAGGSPLACLIVHGAPGSAPRRAPNGVPDGDTNGAPDGDTNGAPDGDTNGAPDGDAYAGAVDVWTTQALRYDESVVAYATEQMLARGAVAALSRKGMLSSARRSEAFKALDRQPRPRIFAGLTLPRPPRPYPTLQPKMPSPARHLYVADVEHLDHSRQLLLASLQGIVNRRRPRIYLLWNDDDRFWLDAMRRNGETGDPRPVADPMSLVATFRSEFRGAVVPDPKVYVSPDVAVDLAGIEDLVIATPELASELRLPIREDLRRRFKDDADALRYVRTALLPRLNPYLSTCLDPPILGSQVDLIVAARGMAFWVTGPKAQDRPGANERAEREEIEATFARLPLDALVHGFWWHGEGVGLDEGPGVSLGSRFGKITTVSDYVANYSVLSGVRRQALKQKPQPPSPKLDRSKVYVAITVSDGDNLVTWRRYFRDQFTDPLHGTFPIAWGMGPTLLDVAPTQAAWYYAHAAPTDEFVCDVSGVGYIDTEDWGTALKDRGAALRSFYDWTARYMMRMDMKTLRLMRPGVSDIAQAGEDLPGVKFLMPDYGYAGERTYGEMTYTLPTGQAVFRAVTGTDTAGMATQIREHVGATRPAFVNAFIMNWGMTLSGLKKMLDSLGPEYVPVTPSQLNTLYRQARHTKSP